MEYTRVAGETVSPGYLPAFESSQQGFNVTTSEYPDKFGRTWASSDRAYWQVSERSMNARSRVLKKVRTTSEFQGLHTGARPSLPFSKLHSGCITGMRRPPNYTANRWRYPAGRKRVGLDCAIPMRSHQASASALTFSLF